jgi:polar amino acid transport system substrate-binding protein
LKFGIILPKQEEKLSFNMKMSTKTIKTFLFSIGLFSLYVINSWASDVTIGVGHTREPYIIMETDSGLEIDIIKAAFNQQGYSAKFRYLTNQRVGFFLKERKVDGILMNKGYDYTKHLGIDAFCSEVHIIYQNYAISLSKNRFQIFNVNDLSDKRVLGFQNAHKYLGPEFAAMTRHNNDYTEKPKQMTQVYWLFLGRTQVVISDKSIFMYHRANALKEGKFDVTKPITFHPIFPPSPIHGIFHSRHLRDELNTGLKTIRKTGQYDTIIKRYESQYQLK